MYFFRRSEMLWLCHDICCFVKDVWSSMLLVGVNCISLIGITTVFDRGSTLFKLDIAMRSAIVSFDVFGCRGDHDYQWAVFNVKRNRVRVGAIGRHTQ